MTTNLNNVDRTHGYLRASLFRAPQPTVEFASNVLNSIFLYLLNNLCDVIFGSLSYKSSISRYVQRAILDILFQKACTCETSTLDDR